MNVAGVSVRNSDSYLIIGNLGRQPDTDTDTGDLIGAGHARDESCVRTPPDGHTQTMRA